MTNSHPLVFMGNDATHAAFITLIATQAGLMT